MEKARKSNQTTPVDVSSVVDSEEDVGYGMPLTTFVHSHIEFWQRVTPNIDRLSRIINEQFRAHPLYVPANEKNNWSVVNTAVDHFTGWLLGAELNRIFDKGMFDSAEELNLIVFLKHLLRRLNQSIAQRIPLDAVDNREILTRIFLLTAQIDVANRTGVEKYMPSYARLGTLDPLNTPINKIHERLKKKVDQSLVDETLSIACRLPDMLPSAASVTYNPIFGAMGLIAGSDGDLVLDDTLYDIKCGAKFQARDIRQLLGYCALNNFNRAGFEITKIGFLNPRRSFVWVGGIEDVCHMIGAVSFQKFLGEMKKEIAV